LSNRVPFESTKWQINASVRIQLEKQSSFDTPNKNNLIEGICYTSVRKPGEAKGGGEGMENQKEEIVKLKDNMVSHPRAGVPKLRPASVLLEPLL
jgi:hypothetical protein